MKPVQILLVEDNPADAELTTETMIDLKIQNELHVVRDGDEAMDFLLQRGVHASAPRPDLILLDLNLPKKDGREVLHEVKGDPRLQMIPVVVMTSSEAHADLVKSYGLHCNAYVRKPLDLAGYHEIVRAIDHFWFKIVKLPPPPDQP